MRGRRPAGPDYVAKLRGPEEAKRRLEVVLRTLAGECRVAEACQALGVSESRFHELRHEALQAALDGLAPRPPGRRPAPAADPRVADLEREARRLRLETEAARMREEIALVLPKLAGGAARRKRASRRKSAHPS